MRCCFDFFKKREQVPGYGAVDFDQKALPELSDLEHEMTSDSEQTFLPIAKRLAILQLVTKTFATLTTEDPWLIYSFGLTDEELAIFRKLPSYKDLIDQLNRQCVALISQAARRDGIAQGRMNNFQQAVAAKIERTNEVHKDIVRSLLTNWGEANVYDVAAQYTELFHKNRDKLADNLCSVLRYYFSCCP